MHEEDIDVYKLVNAILYGSRRKIIQSSQYKTHNIDHIRDEGVIASMDSYTILVNIGPGGCGGKDAIFTMI